MRYSVLAHLGKMARTLQEAAAYIDTAPDEDPLCPELLSNGVKMLEKIRSEIERHRDDLHDPILLEHLNAAQVLWNEGGDALQGALEAFAQTLPKAVRYRVRAVFFTGLGSTWDAMESVYEYMRDDPRFDPVVVLIPVFRQVEQNGQMQREIMYQDYLTHLGVPFLEYRQYNIEDDCPDLAFTNQPYEGCILQPYWPESIAKYTRLVYLFYYVPCLIFEESPYSLCQMEVYRHAWKVMGISDRHCRYYRRHALNGGGNMIVTGLPKLDPAIRLKEKGAKIPDGWLPKIEGRTVVLWNTWYDHDRSALRYFDAVIRWFQAHDDCALIWRPHPMTDTVAKLHYPPEVYAQLQRRIDEVDRMPNGIFDREISCDAAFACSDAQISDYSSLMFQYLLLDKPVLWTKAPNGMNGPYSGMKNDFIIDWHWMEEARTEADVLQFLDQTKQGIDKNKALRRQVLPRDLPLADGHCGERVCEALWKSLHQADSLWTKY